MNKDIHPLLGIRTRQESMEACLQAVRALHPRSHMEGSTGSERSFWVDGELVGHAWPIARSDGFWLRIAPNASDCANRHTLREQDKSLSERRLQVAQMLARQVGRAWGGIAEAERSGILDAADQAVRKADAVLGRAQPMADGSASEHHSATSFMDG